MKKTDVHSEDIKILESFSYKQELKRSLKLFSSFAVAFSFISITTGIFTNYQFVIQTGGPAGIWSWAITVFGQLLVALIFAELAGIIPVSGYSYQWIKRLSSPFVSWLTGWISFCFLILVIPAVDWGLAPVLAGLLNIPITDQNIMIIVMCTIILQVTLNIIGVKLSALINDGAVFTETIGMIGLTIFLFIAAFKNNADPSILISTGEAAKGASYIAPFIMTMLMGSFTLVGFEASANLSEETVNAHKTVPKAVIFSVALSGIFGMLFLIAATLAIPNISTALTSDNPLPYIIQANLGDIIGKLFLVLVCISIFACGLVITTSAGRLIYAMSRDNMFFFSNQFKKISPRTNSPIAATLLILVLCLISTYFAESLTLLVGATAVLPALIYLITIVSYGLNRKNVTFRADSFTLGKFSKPIFILAALWLVIEICILTIPKDFHNVTIISALMVILGIIFYFIFFKRYASNQQ
jgi:amino acid transporter